MTVGELKALLENAAVDPQGQVIFKDQAGNTCNIQVTDFGPVAHLQPSQPSDPSYLEIKLVNP